MRLRILRGLSGSGKSTWAELQALAGGDVIVSRDRIRVALFGSESMHNEDLVTAVQDATIRAALKSGADVIVDDTNVNWRYVKRLAKIGQAIPGCDVSVQTFKVDVDECIKRNRTRANAGGRNVPEEVIRKQAERMKGTYDNKLDPAPEYRQYEYPSGLPAVMVDIDGTLARMVSRGPFDWSKVGEDEVIENVAYLISDLPRRYIRIIMSGRDEVCRPETEAWLDAEGIEYDELYMRPKGDMRPDNIVKYELFDQHVRDEYNVIMVFDDRQQVVDMWRAIGLTVAQVAPGDF
jgi:predicted kinase